MCNVMVSLYYSCTHIVPFSIKHRIHICSTDTNKINKYKTIDDKVLYCPRLSFFSLPFIVSYEIVFENRFLFINDLTLVMIVFIFVLFLLLFLVCICTQIEIYCTSVCKCIVSTYLLFIKNENELETCAKC